MTAWPGTQLFKSLERQGRASRDWKHVRKDMPSIRYKHYSHDEILKAREEVIHAFASMAHIFRVVLRWLFKDRSIILFFIYIAFRNMILERTKRFRGVKSPPLITPEIPVT